MDLVFLKELHLVKEAVTRVTSWCSAHLNREPTDLVKLREYVTTEINNVGGVGQLQETMFTTTKVLEEGIFGKIYAVKEGHGDAVASKTWRGNIFALAKLVKTEKNIQALRRELGIFEKANNCFLQKYVPTLFYAFQNSHYLFLCTELPCGNLWEYTGVDADYKAFFLTSAARALNWLHFSQFCHGDISPECYYIMCDGSIRLGNFRSAAGRSAAVCGGTDVITGRPYDAPELRASHPTPESDFWSFGVMAFEFLSFMRVPPVPCYVKDHYKFADNLVQACLAHTTDTDDRLFLQQFLVVDVSKREIYMNAKNVLSGKYGPEGVGTQTLDQFYSNHSLPVKTDRDRNAVVPTILVPHPVEDSTNLVVQHYGITATSYDYFIVQTRRGSSTILPDADLLDYYYDYRVPTAPAYLKTIDDSLTKVKHGIVACKAILAKAATTDRSMCLICKQSFTKPKSWERHMKTVHATSSTTYTCTVAGCMKKYGRRDHLRRHECSAHKTGKKTVAKKKTKKSGGAMATP